MRKISPLRKAEAFQNPMNSQGKKIITAQKKKLKMRTKKICMARTNKMRAMTRRL